MSLSNLLESRANLDEQIKQARDTHRADGIEKIRIIMKEHDLSLADFGGVVKEPGKLTGSKIATKYRRPSDGASWSGRGLVPKWLTAEIDAGRKREDFLV